jgi:hypothetical protein
VGRRPMDVEERTMVGGGARGDRCIPARRHWQVGGGWSGRLRNDLGLFRELGNVVLWWGGGGGGRVGAGEGVVAAVPG